MPIRPISLVLLSCLLGCGDLAQDLRPPDAPDSADPELPDTPSSPPQMPSTPPMDPMEPEDPTDPTEPVDPMTGAADTLREELLQTLPAPNIPETLPSYAGDPRPPHARGPSVDRFDNTPTQNPITDAGAFLGRVLFYDRLLSHNGEVSCASCHQQGLAFGDPRALSVGFEGDRTRRHSMALVNLRFYENGRMFWDERADTLEEQVLQPIQDEVEMGLSLDELVLRVQSASYYPALFDAAFGTTAVDAELISRALAQFVRSLVSFDSRWDFGVAQVADLQQDFPNFSAAENRGKNLFFGFGRPDLRGACGVCHLRPTVAPGTGGPPEVGIGNQAYFFMNQPRNNGLPERNDDDGFAEVTGDPQDEGAFKSSSLRNIAVTGPYMHDGRLPTLDAVLNFYDRGIQAGPNLDPVLGGPGGRGGRPGIRFNGAERADVVAFLRTLTGSDLLDNPKFSSPFRAQP